MNRFLAHDGLATGLFNRDFCTAQAVSVSWPAQLTNSPELLLLLCDRLEHDYVNLRANMRKPLTARDVVLCLQLALLAG